MRSTEIQGTVDEPDMTERLREIPQLLSSVRINFFCEEPEWTDALQHLLKDRRRFLSAPRESERTDQPKRTESEHALLAG